VTLWVLMILAVLAVTFAATMHVEARAAANELQRTRALYAAHAGIQRAILAVEQDQTGYASPLSEWAQLDSETDQFPFPDDEQYEVTVTDECGKINLNAADEELLARLPAMSDEMIDSILDWRDQDDETRPDGAEFDYYSRLRPPRVCANREFLTLPELLLVRGVSKDAYFGRKVAGQARFETTAQQETGQEDTLPLEELFTVYGGADDMDAQGQERLNINVADTTALAERTDGVLTEGDVQAIVDYRGSVGAFDSIGDLLRVEGISRQKLQQVADVLTTRSRPSEDAGGTPQSEPTSPGTPQLPGLPGSGTGLPNLPGLEGARQVPGGEQPGPPFPPPTPEPPGPTPPQPSSNVADIDLSALREASEFRPEVLNLNTASPEALSTVEGMTDEVLNAILNYRESQPFTSRGELLALKEVSDATFAQLAEEVTVRSSTLKITAVGSVEDGRVRMRVTAILDLKDSDPRIVYLAEG